MIFVPKSEKVTIKKMMVYANFCPFVLYTKDSNLCCASVLGNTHVDRVSTVAGFFTAKREQLYVEGDA